MLYTLKNLIVMDNRIKELLKIYIDAVYQSRMKVIIGAILLTVDIILLLLGILDIKTIIFTFILIFSLWTAYMDYGINKAILNVRRYLIDKEYAKRFDEKNNNLK